MGLWSGKNNVKLFKKQGGQISKVSECGQGESPSGQHYARTREHDPRRHRKLQGQNLSFGLAKGTDTDGRDRLQADDQQPSSVPQVEPGPCPCTEPGAGQPPKLAGSQNCPAPETPFSTVFHLLDSSRELSARLRPQRVTPPPPGSAGLPNPVTLGRGLVHRACTRRRAPQDLPEGWILFAEFWAQARVPLRLLVVDRPTISPFFL